ncbi:uncharacterized protein [Palaemon carinicauda]|uniref:uncharacterized protein isoform X3 n=1 Tax=Palaemon carinicauda TaxID=392227 RepID=UPI0035B5E055
MSGVQYRARSSRRTPTKCIHDVPGFLRKQTTNNKEWPRSHSFKDYSNLFTLNTNREQENMIGKSAHQRTNPSPPKGFQSKLAEGCLEIADGYI